MRFVIDPKIFEQNHDLKVGAVIIKGMNNMKRVSFVESLLRGIIAQRRKEFVNKNVFEDKMVAPWCHAYGKFGVNPKKNSPSIAALLGRIKSGKDLPHINLLVDLYNYFSLKYLLPIGGEDMDWLCGDLKLIFTKGGEPFRQIGEIEVERAKEGEAAYLDDGGITCRYWNYRECERTKFTMKTVNAVLLIEDLSKMHMDEFGRILKDIENAVTKYIGGQVETHILNEEHAELDLGIQGRKNADDSKVPQQEIAYYMEQKKKQPQVEKVEEHPKEASEESVKKAVNESVKAPVEEPSKAAEKRLVKKKPRISSACLVTSDAKSFKSKIQTLVGKSVKKTFPEMEVPFIKIENPEDIKHGDYSVNIAMQIVKEIHLPPTEIAKKIVENLPKNTFTEKVEIAGPGFINFFISRKSLDAEVKKILKEGEEYGSSKTGKGKTIVLDYSSPNIAKPLGVHHLLSTIIGQSLYNIFKKIGFNCVSVNHIGDWGTQFGKLISAYKKWGNKEVVEKNPIDELLKLYVKFHDEAGKDPSLEDEARVEFKKFEEGDEENHKLWEWFVAESMKEINKTYDLLGGIHFDYVHGESFYEDKIGPVLEEGKEKGVFEIGEEGAFVIKFEDPNIPTVPVQKKDGTTLYITRDFATFKYRMERWNPAKILYVVDVSQKMHFIQLFEGVRRMGWEADRGEHVWFGRMSMKDGKMSTRTGNVILLNEVISEAFNRARRVIEEKTPDLKDKERVAGAVGIGAVKYNILCQNRTTDIVFDWDKMLSLEGNSAPYLQYSYARAKSILRKAEGGGEAGAGGGAGESTGKDSGANTSESQKNTLFIEPLKDSENAAEKIDSLIRFFPRFGEQITASASSFQPNILANYLYELAQKFNSFYNGVPVLRAGSEKVREERLRVVRAFAQILKNGLALLGVAVSEEM